ncbi:MAG: ATP-dependent helicase [Chloroflexi bacterium]|nr:ATP-dependent helicase [Chloroflexota bacterium]
MKTGDAQSSLTEVQRQVVEGPAGKLVFLGGPGAGKSLVVAERAVWLVASGTARAGDVLLLAPSRRAAAPLGDRLRQRLGSARPPMATSFHSLALTILHIHYRAMGYRRLPRILDTAHHFEFLRQMLRQENPDLWPNYGRSKGTAAFLKLAYDMAMAAAENGLAGEDLLQRTRFWDRSDLAELARFYPRYRQSLRQAGWVDFGELFARVNELLAADSEVTRSYRRIYRHILVDEFEEANYAQATLLRHLVGGETDLLVAGDPPQAINGFRSGAAANLLACEHLYGARVVTSMENHRCCGSLANIAAAVRPATAGTPVATGGSNLPSPAEASTSWGQTQDVEASAGFVLLRSFTYPGDEARWVAEQTGSLLRAGTAPTQVAVLFRSLAAPLADLIRAELARRSIPCDLNMGRRIQAEPLVVAAIHLVRYLAGQKDALERVLSSPLAGLPLFGLRELRRVAAFGKTSAEPNVGQGEGTGLPNPDLRQGCGVNEYPANKRMALSPPSVCPLPQSVDAVPPSPDIADLADLPIDDELRKVLVDFGVRLAKLEIMAGGTSPALLLWDIWRLFPAFHEDALAGGSGSVAYASFLNQVSSLQERLPSFSLRDLVEFYDRGYFEPLTVAAASRPGVALQTVHQAKGQEWEYVFLPGLVEGTFPLHLSPLDVVGHLLSRDVVADANAGDGSGRLEAARRSRHRDEERRAFYVGVSRARRGLYLSYSSRTADGGAAERSSPFVDVLINCAGVELASGDAGGPSAEGLPADVDGAVVHYRRLLTASDPLARLKGLYALHRLKDIWPEIVQPETWWSNIRETQGAAPPFPAGSLHLSASRLSSYRNCPLGFQFSYHWGLSKLEGAPLTVGSLLHTVLEEYHRPCASLPRTREALENLLDCRFDEKAFHYRPIARQARRALGKMLDDYFGRYGQSTGVVDVERGFRFSFGPHTISGFIDRLDRLTSGELELVDYKTGSPTTKAEAQDDLQLALYDLAFYRDETLRRLGRPAMASYLYLKAIGQRADGKRHYTPTDESRDRLVKLIEVFANGILSEAFPSRSFLAQALPDLDAQEIERALKNDPCYFCPFGWLCSDKEKTSGES